MIAYKHVHLAMLLLALVSMTYTQSVVWSAIPSIRTGQISAIATLTTSSDTAANLTSTYQTPFSSPNNLTYGLSMMSYQSWMTDTFSFNVSLVTVSDTAITVKFAVLDNTFFTKAKVHYMVVWRPGTFPNANVPGSLSVSPSGSAYNNLQSLFGCYLTAGLMSGSGIRSVFVGGNLTSSIHGSNHSQLVTYSMIAGMRLSNNLGNNNYIEINQYFTANDIYYNVTVQNNNYVQFVCVTTIVYDPYVDNYYMKSIIEHETMRLTFTNPGLKNISYSQRFDGQSRMFFGFDKFNLSMADTRYMNVETSNISLVSYYYQKNFALNQNKINLLFFAFRTCVNSSNFYYPKNYTCLDSCPSNSIAYPNSSYGAADFLFCNPCHHSCNTCTSGQDDNACFSCPAGSHRTSTGGSCPCDPGYTDVGVAVCSSCYEAMPGCLTCNSSTSCLSCDGINYVHDPVNLICDCAVNYYKASGYCLNYSGCLQATLFNNTLACVTCDTSLNYISVLANYSCICNQGYFLNASIPQCYDICGDGITAKGHCDDNNTQYGDGCDQLCRVQQGYHCYTNYTAPGDPGISICIVITQVKVTYLYAKRQLNTNKFEMAFHLAPAKAGLTTTSFNQSNFITTLPIQNVQIRYDPNTATVFLQAQYLQTIEGTSHTLTIHYPNDYSFYADSTVTPFTAQGINAQLTLDQNAKYNDVLGYLVIAEGVITIVVAIFASVVGLKLAGLQLLLPVQLLYFSLACLGSQPSFSSNLINLKYSNGYSAVANYQYTRVYSQNKNLVAIAYQSQFLLSTNVMLVIFVIVLIWLLVHHIRIKCKQEALQKFLMKKEEKEGKKEEGDENKSRSGNSDQSQKDQGDQEARLSKKRKSREIVQHNEEDLMEENEIREDHHYSLKIFSFEVDRAYFISYVILINQMLFGFTVMSLNLPLKQFYYAQQISVIICNFLTFILMGNIVFIFYDQTSNKMINFTCINDRYAYIHLGLNTVIILVISYTFQQEWGIYLVTALAVFYVVLVIVERPYSKTMFQLENMVALYLAVMFLICQVMYCVIKAASLEESLQLTITFIIIGVIFIGQVLTVIRIVLKVNFKKAFDDLKNPNSDRDADDKKKLRVKEKNLDLLGKDDAQILPPDSVRKALFEPKDAMVDWQARNTQQYESAKNREGEPETNEAQSNPQEQQEPEKDNKLNQLQLLKRRLKNTLKVKRESQAKKSE